MNTRPEVINELRSLFKEGATPSRLIRHIVERHAGERTFHSLIQAYFHEAFGLFDAIKAFYHNAAQNGWAILFTTDETLDAIYRG